MPTSRQRKVFEEVRHELTRASRRGLNRAAFLGIAGEMVREAIPFDGACWHTVDPSSLLITSHVTNLSGAGFAFICQNEYQEADYNKFADLAGRARPAALLAEATAGHPELSARYRQIFRPRGWASELRASMDAAGVTWGSVMLLREAGYPAFAAMEADFLASVGRHLAHGLRASLLVHAAATNEGADAGWIDISRQGEVEAAAPGILGWLDDLAEAGIAPNETLPAPLLAVAAAARDCSGSDDKNPHALVRTRAGSGRWLKISGSALGDPSDGRVRVILEPPTHLEIAPVIVQAYGLTAREREVAALALRGSRREDIAASLGIAPGTVHDHLESIYEKAGAHGRQEFIGKVFADHYEPHLAAGAQIASDGRLGAHHPRTN